MEEKTEEVADKKENFLLSWDKPLAEAIRAEARKQCRSVAGQITYILRLWVNEKGGE